MMKKWITATLCFVLLLTFAACRQEEEDSIRKRQKDTPRETTAETQAETTEETQPKMTLEQFVEQTKGIWIKEDSIDQMYGDQCSFSALVIGEDYICTAWYPGEFDRSGTIDGFKVLEENVFELPLVFEAGDYMGDYYPESTDTVTITFVEEGKLQAEYSGGYVLYLAYGGQDFEEANRTAGKLLKQQRQWEKMWEAWGDGTAQSPYMELMNYLAEVENGGHSQYFFNMGQVGDLEKELSALEQVLPEHLKDNLKEAYAAYLILEEQDDDNAQSTLNQCDSVVYEYEDELMDLLEQYAAQF